MNKPTIALYAIKIMTISVFLLLTLQPTLSFAQPFTQKTLTQQEDLMTNFITIFNSTHENEVAKFVDSHLSKQTLARFGDEGRARYIGYLTAEKKFHRAFSTINTTKELLSDDSTRLKATVRSYNTELYYDLTLDVTNNKPFKVTRVFVRPAPDNDVVTSITKQELQSLIGSYVDRLTSRGVFSGTILVADQQGVIYESAKGLASIRYKASNNIDTKFNIGSMNKMFTAVAIMQLVEQGKLSLDDKLVRHISRQLFGEGDFDQITIRQLLTHTSGLGRANYPELNQNSLRNLNDHQPYLKHFTLANTPGQTYRYSNDGMLLLGMVIEQVSGENYYDYIRKHIYQIAHMDNSDSFDVDLPIPNIAMGYFYSAELDSMQSNLFLHPIKGGPAGGGFSTVRDLHRFAQALTNYKLLSESLTKEAYTAKPLLNSPNYGYGFSVSGTPDDRIIGHSGSYIGASAYFRIFLDRGYIVAILANKDFASEPVSAKIEALLQQLSS